MMQSFNSYFVYKWASRKTNFFIDNHFAWNFHRIDSANLFSNIIPKAFILQAQTKLVQTSSLGIYPLLSYSIYPIKVKKSTKNESTRGISTRQAQLTASQRKNKFRDT